PEVQGGVRQDRGAGRDHPVWRPEAVHRVRQGHGCPRGRIPLAADRQEVKKPLGADLVIPALALGFAIYFFISIADLAWEAKANGVVIGIALIALVVVQVARIGIAVAQGRGDLGTGTLWQPRDVLAKRV